MIRRNTVKSETELNQHRTVHGWFMNTGRIICNDHSLEAVCEWDGLAMCRPGQLSQRVNCPKCISKFNNSKP